MRQEPNRAGEMTAFVRVVEHGSFAHAGTVLGLSPSALSKLITRLEQRLGVTLFRRSTRRLALTPEGEQFYTRALGILSEIELAESEVGAARLPSGRVRINSSASYVTHVLAPILPEFLARYPMISLELVQTDMVTDLLRDGTDIAIRAGELTASNLIARSLGDTALIVVAAPSWVARHGLPATPEELPPWDRLGFAYPRAVGDWLHPGAPAAARVRVNDGEGIRHLALAGVGPARLAEFAVRADLAQGRLVQLLPHTPPAKREPFHAVYVGQAGQLPARIRVLLDFLAAAGRIGPAEEPPGPIADSQTPRHPPATPPR